MARYAGEIADLFSCLELKQIKLFVEKLSAEEIKLLHAVVLPKIKSLEHRRDLKQILINQEKNMDKSSEKNQTPQKAQSISDHLKVIFSNLTTTILSGLTDVETKKLFLKRATNDELFVLESKLSTYNDERWKEFHLALADEIEGRKQPGQAQTDKGKDIYVQDLRKKHGNLQWESNVWQNIIKSVKQVNLEVINKIKVEIPQPKKPQETQINQQSWFTEVFSNISNIFSSPKQQETEPYQFEITANEKKSIEEIRSEGAKRIANVTGVVRVGEAETISEEGKKKAMMSRFGMVMASQMVAGTKSDNHRILYTVLESLAKPEDNDKTIETIQNTIKNVIPDTKDGPNPIKGKHACATGGNPEFVTAFESEVVHKLVKSPEQYDLSLSEQEKAKLERYYQNMGRSQDINNALTAICYSWGGYERDKENNGYKKAEDFEKKQQIYEDRLAVASKALQDACSQLQDGEALYLETGIENHAMQLVIKKEGNEFKLSTYDSSGALENTELSKSLFGLIQLSRLRGTEAKRKNAYSFSVPQERLISAKGLDYLSGLIRSNSLSGWAQTHIDNNLSNTSREERSHMGWLQQLLALNQQRVKYAIYMAHFGSLDPDAPPKFEDLLQHPQNTSNCFAKKAQSCELYELGKPIYKKFRLAMLLEQKDKLLKEIEAGQERFVSMEFAPMLKDIESEYLSPSELHEVSMRLCEVKEPPSKEYYKKFFQTLLDAREKLSQVDNDDNKLAIKRIDEKIASHAKSYYLYLKKGNRLESELNTIFSPEVSRQGSAYDWNSEMSLKTDSNGAIDPIALEKLSEYAAAQAWKASFQLLNHQIRKLSVNERYINSASERLSHANYREAADEVTLNDLENANVVNFTTGFARNEDIKIELEIKVGATRKEIDKATFFKLLMENQEALTSPKVISLLDCLRNASPDIEKRYMQEVNPTQRKVFEHKTEALSQKTTKFLKLLVERLSEILDKLELMIKKTEDNIRLIEQEINDENRYSNEKRTIKLENLELRLALLKKEHEEIKGLETSISAKIKNLKLDQDVPGSAQNKISRAESILEQLKASDVLTSTNKLMLRTINFKQPFFLAPAKQSGLL